MSNQAWPNRAEDCRMRTQNEHSTRFDTDDTLHSAFERFEKASADSDETSMMHLPHYMAVELEEQCSAEHRSCTCLNFPSAQPQPARLRCTGDHPHAAPHSTSATDFWPYSTLIPSSQFFSAARPPLHTPTNNNSFGSALYGQEYGPVQAMSYLPASYFGPEYGNATPTRYLPYLNGSQTTSLTNPNTPSTTQSYAFDSNAVHSFLPVHRNKMVYNSKFGSFGSDCGQFTEPSGVCVHPVSGDIVIADTNNHRVQVFDCSGQFKFLFGKCGRWDGQLMYPNRVCVDSATNNFVISERAPTHQVQLYDQRGQFIRRFGSDLLCNPRGLCVDSQSRVIVVECKVMRIVVFDDEGNLLHLANCGAHLSFPNNACVSEAFEVFISDNGDHCVKVFNYSGHYLRRLGGPGITNYPIAVAINNLNEVVVIDNHNNFNITVFTMNGQLVDAFESKVKHAQCLDAALTVSGQVIMCSKDYRAYIYRYRNPPALSHREGVVKTESTEDAFPFQTKCSLCIAHRRAMCSHVSYSRPGSDLLASAEPPSLPHAFNQLRLSPNRRHTLELQPDLPVISGERRDRKFFIEITIPDMS